MKTIKIDSVMFALSDILNASKKVYEGTNGECFELTVKAAYHSELYTIQCWYGAFGLV